MRSADVDGPGKARPYSEYRLLPAEAFHAEPDERLTTGQVDGRLQEKRIDQLEPSFLNALPDLVNPFRMEVHDGDQVVDFRENESVIGVVTHAIQMIQIAVRAEHALFREGRQPSAACRVKIRHHEHDSLGAGQVGLAFEGGRANRHREKIAPVHLHGSPSVDQLIARSYSPSLSGYFP